MASPVSVPNTFTAATDAVAAEVNANFTSLVDYINNNMVHSDGTVNITGTQSVNNLTVTGTLTGNITGNATGSSGSCTGNAATATQLAATKNIDVTGVTATAAAFDGSADVAINVTAVPSSLLTGTIDVARVPDLAASKIDSGTFGNGDYTFPGNLDVNGLVKVNDGSASAPTFTFDNDENNGMYLSGTDELSFTTAGTQRVAISSGGNVGLETSGATYLAVDPGAGAGVDADWISVFGVTYGLKRNSSLAAEKENISADLGTHLTADMIDNVVPKMWNRITAPGIPEIGPIAEDMDAISPFLAAKSYDANGDPELLGINRNSYLSLMVLAIKDLRERMEAVEAA